MYFIFLYHSPFKLTMPLAHSFSIQYNFFVHFLVPSFPSPPLHLAAARVPLRLLHAAARLRDLPCHLRLQSLIFELGSLIFDLYPN